MVYLTVDHPKYVTIMALMAFMTFIVMVLLIASEELPRCLRISQK